MLTDVTAQTRATSFADGIVRPLAKSLPLVCAGLNKCASSVAESRTVDRGSPGSNIELLRSLHVASYRLNCINEYIMHQTFH